MTILSLEQGLRKRLWVIDIPLHLRSEFIRLVLKWYRCSGVEWTIKRLKTLKVDFYRRRAGLEPLGFIRKNRHGDLAGTLGGLFRWGSKSDKNFQKVVQTLMCYTVFRYSKPTLAQVKKFTQALSASPPKQLGLNSTFLGRVSRNFGGLIVDRKEEVSLLLYRGSPSKRKPSEGMRSIPQDSNILKDLDVIQSHSWGISLMNQFEDLFRPVVAGLEAQPISTPFGIGEQKVEDPCQIIGGKIAFLQEPGGKLRSVASPLVLYQLALRHFGKSMYSFVHRLPWDCTHEQSKPVKTLQDSLRKGSTVHSVDLSSATDYFPLEFQLQVLRALYGNIPDIHLFEMISRSTWISPIGPVHWNRGQPLGLFPSFAVFTASHGLLLWYLNNFKWKKKFFVLGDDVVILDDNLYRHYIETLQSWGCPYSPDKSLSSHQICEFAGKVITGQSVTPQYKWREMSNDNFVDIARQLGPRSRILLTRRQQKVFDLIKNLVAPFGLNFSYQGSNLLDMEDRTRQALQSVDERILDSLVDQARVVYKNLYGSSYKPSNQVLGPTSIDLPVVLKKLETFDEKVRLVLKKCLPWFRNLNQDPRQYSSVPMGVGFESDLPLAILQPSRITQLDRLEKIFSL